MRLAYAESGIELWEGSCFDLDRNDFDVAVTDPPYGETSLEWDRWPAWWLAKVRGLLKTTGSLWCCGSMRMFLDRATEFADGWRLVQDLVWEKQNGTAAAVDRFRRVHELALQFRRDDAAWADVYKNPVTTPDAVARRVKRTLQPTHGSVIGESEYETEAGGPRLMRSVLKVKNMHGRAVHPTQKPEGLIEPMLRYSCPPGGVVLDPFAGSGTTLVVAKRLGLRAVGVEVNPEYVAAAVGRLRGELL